MYIATRVFNIYENCEKPEATILKEIKGLDNFFKTLKRLTRLSNVGFNLSLPLTQIVRVISVPGKTLGDWAEFGGVHKHSSVDFINRGCRIPCPST